MPKKDKYTEKRFDICGEESIDVKVLESIPFYYPGSDTDVTYETDEFTCVCPWTGLPDFGTISITYLPKDKLIELKSLKYYLTSFRNVGIIQEHAVNRILNDLVKLIKPVSMTGYSETIVCLPIVIADPIGNPGLNFLFFTDYRIPRLALGVNQVPRLPSIILGTRRSG
jgi:7-cyano-7-deazaguanine reductase